MASSICSDSSYTRPLPGTPIPGSPLVSFCSKKGTSKICSKPLQDGLTMIKGVKTTECTYLRGTTATAVLPEDIADCIPSYNDPLMVPLANVDDDYQNFGGGVNPLGYKGHTFTENGYGPIYTGRMAGHTTCTKSIVRPAYYMHKKRLPRDVGKKPVVTSCAQLDDANTKLDQMAGTAGAFMPLTLDVTLADIGESLFFTDNVYIAWRALYLLICLMGVIVSLTQARGPAWLASCFAMTYAAVHGTVGFRRTVQMRVLKHTEAPDKLMEQIPFSWLDVMAMQAAPVVCIMVGVVLPAVLPLTIKSHGLATSYYHGTTFYATAGVTFSTLLDMWFGSLPTRLSYILFPTILSGAVAIGAAHDFQAKTLVGLVVGTAIGAVFTGTLLHVVVRTLVLRGDDGGGKGQKDREEVEALEKV